jgi:hypothetical protein
MTTNRLSPTPPERPSLNYGSLRTQGLGLIQQLAGESWTDHNSHDPGITLLEACCYAITELGFRIQQDLPDLLHSGAAEAQPTLAPAHRTLPVAPVTPADLRRVLLDHPLVQEAQISASDANASDANRIEGFYDVLVVFADPTWNSNTYALAVTVAGQTYFLEIALPYWDDPEAAPFRTGAITAPTTLTLVPLGPGVWRPLGETQSYFGNLAVDDGSGNTTTLWVVVRLNDGLNPAIAPPAALLEAARLAIETPGTGSLIHRFIERVQAAYGGAMVLQRYVDSWRNLGEVPLGLQVARQQEIGLRARIEVASSTNLEQLLAEIMGAIDLALSPPVVFATLAEQQQQGKTPDSLYAGPLLRHGFLVQTDSTPLARDGQIYTSDILRLIMQHRQGTKRDVVAQENPTGRTIVAVTDLALSNFINNRPITRDAQDCLRLVDPQRYVPRLSLAKSRITFVRHDLEIPYDGQQVADRLALGQALPRERSSSPFPWPWPVPPGETLPIADYIPLQNDLPRLYGVGETGVVDGSNGVEQARSLQTKGYLLLFEQFLADVTAQLSHINHFFSPGPNESATYFTRPLLDISGTATLLKRAMPSDLPTTDPNHPYRQVLQGAVETVSQFYDRRNRMLDHLLARQGETMITWAQELHRWAQKDLAEALQGTNLDAQGWLAAVEDRRQQVNARLIQDKAKFLGIVPELNAHRLQAFGHPLRWEPTLVQLDLGPEGIHWQLTLPGGLRLRSSQGFATQAAAAIAAETTFVLAAQPQFYRIVGAGGGQHRYQLATAAHPGAPILAASVRSWSTPTTASRARDEIARQVASLRLETSLTAMERRIAALTGIRRQGRQRLITPLADYFEIYDEVDEDDLMEKRWRLWQRPRWSGQVLLSSVWRFEHPDEATAIAMATAAIQQAIRYGLDRWNYHISPAGPETFNFHLRHPTGTPLGLRHTPVPSEAITLGRVHQTLDHLYTVYSAEGFHTVEHLLLRPQAEAEPDPEPVLLTLPDASASGGESDPYSHRISLVFPSGYGRDFTAGASDGSTRNPTPPHRFRDREFRRHVEHTVHQACPAHLQPTLYWVDRQAPEVTTEWPPLTPDSLGPISFDQFEAIYFDWLTTQLLPGTETTAMVQTRRQLILALNALAQQSPSF